MKVFLRLSLVLVLLFANAPRVCADVRLAGVFAEHMVLQRDRPLQVWGWADKGEEVSVEFAEHSAKATVGEVGTWCVTLKPLAASAQGRELRVQSAGEKIDGKSVVVTSEKVQTPVAVRYAYEVTPENCNLYNRDGLPASPFCSDPTLLRYDPGLPQ